ncbi:MAG TPA: hypothetical protein VGM82_05280 [Gemmatimonadaceae bacterium]|jgi:hypothetical protein
MPAVDLMPGDVIVTNGSDHCVMWVDDPAKPLAHSVSVLGVIQQSDGYFRRTARPVYVHDHAVWRIKPKHGSIAENAAAVAANWAVQEGRAKNRGKTPFGSERWLTAHLADMGHDLKMNPQQSEMKTRWEGQAKTFDVQSVYKIVKMYTRFVGEDGSGDGQIPLSARKGVTCSQFVMYSYQIANLLECFGDQPINQGLQFKPETLAGWLDVGATSTKEGNVLLAAQESAKGYAEAQSLINKFRSEDKSKKMNTAMGDKAFGLVQFALLPSLQSTTQFLTAEVLVEEFLPRTFEKMGFYVPYCGAQTGPTAKIWTHRYEDKPLQRDETVDSRTKFDAGHQIIFGEKPLPS